MAINEQSIRQVCEIVFGKTLPDEMANILPWMMTASELDIPTWPLEGETAAITFSRKKTAALCFDRVWGFPWPNTEMYVPPEIIFKGGTLEEISVACMDLLLLFANVDKRELERDSEAYKKLDAISRIAREATDPWFDSIEQTRKGGAPTIRSERIISTCIQKKHRIPAVSVYDDLHNYENDFQIASDRKTTARRVVLISLTNLDIIDEKSLTWEQVSEFRKDTVLQGKYRRFLHWLNAEMVRKSEDEIQNEIGRKLDDYEQTLRIHGIKTIKGTLQWVLSGKPLAKSLALAGGFAALTNSPLGAFLVGGGYLVKEAAFHIWESNLELLQLEAEHRDIAWVYDAKHKLESISAKGN